MASKRQRFAQRRKAVGLSQEELAERLGVERSTVVRWENGDTYPQPWLRPKIARALQISVEQLDHLLDVDGGLIDDAEGRLGYVLKHPAAVDLVTVASMRDQLAQIDEQYDRVPSASLLPDAGRCLGQISFLAGHARGGRVRRELHAVEAEAATLMGQLVWDASQRRDHHTTISYLDHAIRAARQIRDRAAEGRALLRKGFAALYGKHDPKAGLGLAAMAADTTNDVSHALTGLAILHAAEANAMVGEKRACEQALVRAETHFDRVDADDPAIDLFSPAQLGRLAGSCYLFLGDARLAQPILEETAAALRDHSKSQAIVLGNLALSLIRQRKIDEAVGALDRAIDVIEINRGGGGLNIAFGAARELRPWRQVQAVQNACDRLLALMTAA